ncbi:MAG: hypothetical protein ACLUNO_05110 [Oscillospiraceae bacterium]
MRDRVRAQRDAAKKAIQTLQKQINIPPRRRSPTCTRPLRPCRRCWR